MSLQRVDEQYRGLVYPWGRLEHPGDEPFEVAPGVWWVRFAMPGPLNHINLWLLEDSDGWTIVDTCLNLDSAKAQWESLFDGFMAGKPVKRVICTHMHPDHIGLAGWLFSIRSSLWSNFLNSARISSVAHEGNCYSLFYSQHKFNWNVYRNNRNRYNN